MFQVPVDKIEKASGLIVFDKISRNRITQIRPKIPFNSWREKSEKNNNIFSRCYSAAKEEFW